MAIRHNIHEPKPDTQVKYETESTSSKKQTQVQISQHSSDLFLLTYVSKEHYINIHLIHFAINKLHSNRAFSFNNPDLWHHIAICNIEVSLSPQNIFCQCPTGSYWKAQHPSPPSVYQSTHENTHAARGAPARWGIALSQAGQKESPTHTHTHNTLLQISPCLYI